MFMKMEYVSLCCEAQDRTQRSAAAS